MDRRACSGTGFNADSRASTVNDRCGAQSEPRRWASGAGKRPFGNRNCDVSPVISRSCGQATFSTASEASSVAPQLTPVVAPRAAQIAATADMPPRIARSSSRPTPRSPPQGAHRARHVAAGVAGAYRQRSPRRARFPGASVSASRNRRAGIGSHTRTRISRRIFVCFRFGLG